VCRMLYSLSGKKRKKRERADQNLDPSGGKRERNVKFDDHPDTSTLRREQRIATILNKDGGLLNVGVVEHLVQLMRNDPQEGTGGRKLAPDVVVARRSMLAGVIAATENAECLNQFVHLGGLCSLDDWLQEAHKGKVGEVRSPKEYDKGVEDLLLTLLRALDRLPVDLKALKTCYVGKSTNHLRSHKNLDIQKKARKLVDVWKKLIDAEMKASVEAKPGSGRGISWSYYKQSLPAEPVHTLTKAASGGLPEVAMKSSVALAGNAKVTSNGANAGGDAAASAKPPQGVPLVSKTATSVVLSPDLPALKESNARLTPTNLSPDVPANPVKEEKSSRSSLTLSNGHSRVNALGKGGSGGIITSKEDVKTSVAFSTNGSSKTSSVAGSSHLPNNKVVPGGSPPGSSKEVSSGKPQVWNRSVVATEKAVVGSVTETSSSQQRLIVRIPNPGKSPGRTSGAAVDVATPVSRSSSPSVLERHLSTVVADVVLETKNRPPQAGGSQAALSPPEAGADFKVGNGAKSGTGGESEEDQRKPPPQNNDPPVNVHF
jgi:hypothetical protein